MNTTKIIKGAVNSGRYTVTAPIVKEDYGLYLQIEGVELPSTYEVDFSNSEHSGASVTMIGNSNGVLIPHQFIDTGKDIFAFLYHVGANYGRTVYKFRIPNKVRPDRTEEEPTPEEQSVIDQAISALNTAVAKTAQDVVSADQSARSASDDADRAERARTGAETAQGKAEEAQESAERAKDDAETSERNASESERKAKGYAETASEKADAITGLTATATTLPDGSSASASYNAETGVMSFGIPKGRDGTDGDDGYSPTASVTKSGKTATITITDKNGTTTAQVSDGTDGTDGEDGVSPAVSVTDITGGHRVVITDKDGTKSFDVEDGATGATPNLTIGTVETLEPTDDATATITGTPENPVLNLGIPQGDAGEVTLADLNTALAEKAPVITDTASGSIASFSDGADGLPLKSLVVDINPVQDLSHGDPSPENICPISGWTSVDVEQSGVNVWDEEWERGTIDTTGAKKASVERIRSKNYIPVAPNTTYYIGISSYAISVYGCIRYAYDINKNPIGVIGSNYSTTFTTPDNCYFVMISPHAQYGTTYNHDISINYPSTDHDYHAYTGRSITINLGQTVYGGHLDVISGVLTVDRYFVDPSQWTRYNASNGYIAYLIINIPYGRYGNDTMNMPLSNMIAKFGGFSSSAMRENIIQPPRINANRAYLALQDGIDPTTVELSYLMLTPITIQLTPQQVNSLLGVNNIWADSGDAEVEYRADTKAWIQRKIAEAIASLT